MYSYMSNKKVSVFDFNFKDEVFCQVGECVYIYNDKKNNSLKDMLKVHKYKKCSFADILFKVEENGKTVNLLRCPGDVLNVILTDNQFNYLVDDERIKARQEQGFYDVML